MIKGRKKIGNVFKGKLMNKVAQRRKAAEEEARRKEAEAEELARQMALAEEEERERLAAEGSARTGSGGGRKRAEEESKPKVRPVFGCQFAFSEDLRFDPFSRSKAVEASDDGSGGRRAAKIVGCLWRGRHG